MDVIALDWNTPSSHRFQVDYLFFGSENHHRLQLQVPIANNDAPEIETISDIYGAANWGEREAYDMMGIVFTNHPKMKRLIMWENFEGYPLRKDYPLAKRQPIPVLDELI